MSPSAIPRALRALGFALLALSASTDVFAHGTDEERIERLDAEVRDHPTDANLLLQRADLLREAGHAQAAARDYARVLSLNPLQVEAHLGKTTLLLNGGRLAEAHRALDACPTGDGILEARKLRLRADIFRAEQKWVEAANALDRAIAKDGSPRPEDYVERAELALAAGVPDEALAVLDRGIERLNGAVSLRWRAIEIAIQAYRTEFALAQLDHLEEVMPGAALVRARRGDVFAACGRNLEASAAWTEALARIESISLEDRSPADRSLAERLHRDLQLEIRP